MSSFKDSDLINPSTLDLRTLSGVICVNQYKIYRTDAIARGERRIISVVIFFVFLKLSVFALLLLYMT